MRKVISKEEVEEAVAVIVAKLHFRLQQKGPRSYASTHEALGIITEEYHELVEAVKLNDMDAFEKECIDVAVGCIFSVACRRAAALEW